MTYDLFAVVIPLLLGLGAIWLIEKGAGRL